MGAKTRAEGACVAAIKAAKKADRAQAEGW
jgi:hypothetical protein